MIIANLTSQPLQEQVAHTEPLDLHVGSEAGEYQQIRWIGIADKKTTNSGREARYPFVIMLIRQAVPAN